MALDAAAVTKWADPIQLKKRSPAPSPEPRADPPLENDTAAAPPTGTTSFPIVLGFAFLGGVILNVMPCVLPVVGLKIMGFVSQAGEDRRRILVLNVAYVAGIFAVFAALAALAIVFNFGWGQQFQYFSVRLGVTLGLFAFALSYFNIREIPVPGMAANKTSQELQSREGLAGAFSKGVFATLLATPCSGPMLGGVFGATIGLPSTHVALIFMTMALGMSTPYLLIGLRPEWIKWLPKPGAWMETFKQFMAFFFLAAVAYFFYQFSDENKFPVFVTLIGVWFGCWIIGLVPNWETLQKRLVAWVGGISVATAVGLGAFMLLKAESQLQWVDYTEASLRQYQAEGKTVLLDFSAKWCVNCLVNLETAIDTEQTRALVEELDVVTMYADWTNYDPEVTRKLEELNSKSIPMLAIYPGSRPDDPIILRDLVSQSTVLDALRSAGPSIDSSASLSERDKSLASMNR
jgi:thiol:disulfide interchange protein